jgi:DNA-binding NarL/FixJ family response regulator
LPTVNLNDVAPARFQTRDKGVILSFHVLIVDDNAGIRHAIRSLIERETQHHVCGEAENGEIAVARVKELHPDVVILDMQMPVMNGLEAAREISQLSPDTAMVMVTMHCSEQLRKDARAVGIMDVVSKHNAIADGLLASLGRVCVRP